MFNPAERKFAVDLVSTLHAELIKAHGKEYHVTPTQLIFAAKHTIEVLLTDITVLETERALRDAPQAQPAAVPAANVTPMRQPRADLARLVESINAAVYANGDGLSVTEAIGALELAKLELLKEQGQ